MSPVSSPKYSSGSTLLSPYGPFDQSLGYSRPQVLSSGRYGTTTTSRTSSTTRYLSPSPCQDRVQNYHYQERGRPDPHGVDLRMRRGGDAAAVGRPQVRGHGLRPGGNVARGRSTTRVTPVSTATSSPTSPMPVRRRSVSYSDLSQELVLLDIRDAPSSPSLSPSSPRPPARQQHRAGRQGTERNCRVLQRNIENSKNAQGLVGLRNLGNTCFMNSILQCLSNTHDLRDYCLRNCHLTDLNKSCRAKAALMDEFAKLTQTLWTSAGNEAISPSDFKTQIQKYAPRFVGYNQQDAQEFLRFLLDGLHNEVNRVVGRPRVPVEDFDHLSDEEKGERMWSKYLEREDSKVVDLFVGQLKSSLTCNECGFCSTVFDPFWDLSLPIPKKGSSEVTLTDCIRLFTKEDVLDGDEKPICQRCKSRRKCTKKFTVQKFPKILVLHLKRFSEPGRVKTSKLSTFVNFPLKELDLREFASENSATAIYNLYAVSNHIGTTLGGHYTAYCRNPALGEWHSYNDSRVSPMSSSQVRSSDAYVLFYELATSSRM